MGMKETLWRCSHCMSWLLSGTMEACRETMNKTPASCTLNVAKIVAQQARARPQMSN